MNKLNKACIAILLTVFTGTAQNILIASILVLTATSASATESFYQKLLFMPSSSFLKAESRGRIMIYDGLDSKTVDRAMDEQFDRIDNMMFIRVRHVQESGEEYVEKDGCD